MKKKITITIECETSKDDDFIKKVLLRGTFKALDTEPYYISAPNEVDAIIIDISEIGKNLKGK